MSVSISKVTESDIPKILDIQIECDLSNWTAEDYQKEITRIDSIFLAAKIGGKTVGFLTARFAIINQSASEPVSRAEIDIINFGVFKKLQKQGIGKLLFEYLLNESVTAGSKTIWLEVRESNLDAICFYINRGFKAIQTRKNFYRQPLENAVVMKYEIKTENFRP